MLWDTTPRALFGSRFMRVFSLKEKNIKYNLIKAVGIVCVLCVAFPFFSFAGEINSEEERIIEYYNQVFYYQGEEYVATEAAKLKAYNKLLEDDVDLTKDQVDALIAQADVSIAEGIERGYLVLKNPLDTVPESTGGAIGGYSENDNIDTGSSKIDSEDIDESNADENGKAEEPNDSSEQLGPKWTDIDDLEDELQKEVDNLVVSKEKEQRNENITESSYSEGVITVKNKNGDVIYQANMPIKNTGLDNMGLIWGIGIILIGLIVSVLLDIFLKKKRYRKLLIAALLSGVVVCSVIFGFSSIIMKTVASWRQVFIAGAPKYDYVYEKSEENLVDRINDKIIDEASDTEDSFVLYSAPIEGAVYAEISCEDIDLKTPVYWGDKDEYLELGVGTWNGSVLPGEKGLILVGGHDTTAFAALEEIEEGMVITMNSSLGKYMYKVSKIVIDSAENASKELIDSKDSFDGLVLYTCYPFGSNEIARSQRFFVYATSYTEGE